MIKKPLLKIIHFILLFIIGLLFTIFLYKIKNTIFIEKLEFFTQARNIEWGPVDCKGITLPCSINCETGSNRFIVTQKAAAGGSPCDYPSDCEDGDDVCDSSRLKRVGFGGSWPDKINTTDELNKARQIIIPPWVGELITGSEHEDKATIDEDKKSKLKTIYRYDLNGSGGSCVDDVYGGSVVGSYMYKIEGNNRDLYRKCDGLYDSNGSFVGNYTF